MLDLYKNIRRLRLERGLSQNELAKLTGYTDRSSIAKIEKGEVDLTESKILAFAKALGVSPSELMGWKDTSEKQDYYFNPDTVVKSQEVYDKMRLLFDAAQDSEPDDIQMATDLLNRLKGTNPDG